LTITKYKKSKDIINMFAGIVFILLLVSFTLSFASIDVKASVGNATKNRSFANVTQYEFVKNWGGEGDEEGQFERPHDLDFSPTEDKLYAIDRDNQRVQVFDKNGTYLFEWGSEGEGEGEFTLPYGMDVDREGNVWVADRGGHRIQKFDHEGNFLLEFGSDGTGEGEFSHPRQVAVDDALQYVYVADSRNHRIQKFDTNGNFIDSFGTEGNQSGQFNLPTSVIIDSRGYLYINERGNERVQKFDANGNLILMWGSKGSGPNQFCHVEHLAVDKFDNIYVTDPQSDPGCSNEARISKFDSNGHFITQWKLFGVQAGVSNLDPEHMAIDSEGNIYVSERTDDQIQVYKPVINGSSTAVT
jgi:tripartite motif-containing protein 71